MTTLGTFTAGAWAIIGLVLTLWLASMGAAWKVATLLAGIASELRDVRREASDAKRAGVLNAANLALIQQRFNVPQANESLLDDLHPSSNLPL